jgi:hypothetical protein
MRKGFFASVAALVAGTGVALGQGWPGGPASAPPAYPTWPGAGPTNAGVFPGGVPMVPPGGMPAGAMPPAGMPGGAMPPAGMPMGAMPYGGMPAGAMPPGALPPGAVPPATDMPAYGRVDGPNGHENSDPGYQAGLPPTAGYGSPQVHRAAGGPDRWYINLEQIVWQVKSQPVGFPLVTAGPPAGAGLLGAEGTHVLFGGESIDYDNFNVFRLTVGAWGPARCWGVEAGGFIQEAKGEYFDISQPVNQLVVVGGRQVIARPAIDAFTLQPTSLIVALPGVSGGEAHVQARLKMGGGEANVLRSLLYCDRWKFNLLAGVRYIDHDENLQVITRSVIPGATDLDSTLTDVFDEFATRNQFLGGQLGFQSEWRHDRIFVNCIGKIGLGNMHETLQVNGFTNTIAPGGVATSLPGGLLALVTNSGEFNQNKFAYVPELTLTFGYQWTQRVSTFIGYNALYMSKVLRPGDQIDPVVNPVYLPSSTQFGGEFGPIRPANTFKESEFWTQGVTFGLSIRY